MRARIGVYAAVLAATILVAACSGDEDEPSSLPDATTAGSAVTPTDTGSTSPADPTAQLEAEITDFYKLYVETINESWTSEQALQRRREMFVDTLCYLPAAGYELTKGALRAGPTHWRQSLARFVELDSIAFDGDVVTFLGIDHVACWHVYSTPRGEVVQEFGATSEVHRSCIRAQRDRQWQSGLLQVTRLLGGRGRIA